LFRVPTRDVIKYTLTTSMIWTSIPRYYHSVTHFVQFWSKMGQFSTRNDRTQKLKIVIIVNEVCHDKLSVATTRRLQTSNPKHPHLDACQTRFVPPPFLTTYSRRPVFILKFKFNDWVSIKSSDV